MIFYKKTLQILKIKITSDILINESIKNITIGSRTKNIYLRQLLKAINNIKIDKYKAIELYIEDLSKMEWATIEEIRSTIFKLKNKISIVAFLKYTSIKEYFLASSANTILMEPMNTLNIMGLNITTIFTKKLLEKVGIDTDIIRTGNYKTALNLFTLSKISREQYNMLHSILKSYMIYIKSKIIESRSSIDKYNYDKIINNAVYTSGDAIKNKLIDDVVYYHNIEEFYKKRLNSDRIKIKNIKIMSKDKKKPLLSRVLFWKNYKKVSILYLNGEITSNKTDNKNKYITEDNTIEVLNQIEKSKSIHGVIIYINSPGGCAKASDNIFDKISQINISKPIIVHMLNVAASGGYYISCGSKKIISNPLTLTGSIGVIYGKFIFKKMLSNININTCDIYTHKSSSIFSPLKYFTKYEKNKFHNLVYNFYYKRFLKIVSDSRDIDIETLNNLAGGKVWTGLQAKKNKLVNSNNNMLEAENQIASLLKIDKNYLVYKVLPKRKTSIKLITNKLLNNLNQKLVSYIYDKYMNIKRNNIFLKYIMNNRFNIN